MWGMTEVLLVLLSTARLDARECTPRTCFRNDPLSLSIEFLHCFSDRKSLGKGLELKNEAPHTSQL